MAIRGLSIGYERRGGPWRRSRAPKIVAADLRGIAPPGQLTSLIGPNGAGKSTLLRTVCGLQPALGGTIDVGGTELTTLEPAELARTIAVVLTERVDPGMLSVREVVGLGRTPHLSVGGRLRESDHRIVAEAMAAAGVTELAQRHLGQLSDGQRQRVMVARALAQQPRLLVLDEPTSFLDIPSRVELLDMLARLARDEGIAVLVSTHELELALRLSDQIWLLTDDGPEPGLVTGTPGELAGSGRIGAAFNRGRLHFDPQHLVFEID